MLLHCWICSLQGSRIDNNPLSPTLVTEIIEDKIKLPLKADMFKTYDPDKRGLREWPLTDDWDHMLHHNHLPWEMTYDDEITRKRVVNGGPGRLLTDKGWIEIDDIGIVPKGGRPDAVDASEIELQGDGKQEIMELYCTVCGVGPFKNKQQRGSHVRYEHKKE